MRANMRANPFTCFFARRLDEKRDTTKSHREVIFHLFAGNSPLNQILPKIGIWVGDADVTNHTKFGNDRSREYKVTEGRILACSIGMACRL